MCGIAGFITTGSTNSLEKKQQFLVNMTDAVTHRGPDNSGYWSDAKTGLKLMIKQPG